MRAVAVHAGVAEAAVGLGLAVGVVEALGAHAAEAVHLVDARAAVVAGAGRALVDVHVASGACKSRFTGTVVAINAIHTGPTNTRVTGTVVKVILTVYS